MKQLVTVTLLGIAGLFSGNLSAFDFNALVEQREQAVPGGALISREVKDEAQSSLRSDEQRRAQSMAPRQRSSSSSTPTRSSSVTSNDPCEVRDVRHFSSGQVRSAVVDCNYSAIIGRMERSMPSNYFHVYCHTGPGMSRGATQADTGSAVAWIAAQCR